MTAGLMSGKRGLIMGVANDHSIAWGIAKRLAEQGAELAFTYQPPNLDKRVRPLAKSVGSEFVIPCDVGLDPDAAEIAALDTVFAEVGRRWTSLDFVVHAIAFSDKAELKGRYAETTRANFKKTMVISCFSFTEMAKRAAKLMRFSVRPNFANAEMRASMRASGSSSAMRFFFSSAPISVMLLRAGPETESTRSISATAALSRRTAAASAACSISRSTISSRVRPPSGAPPR